MNDTSSYKATLEEEKVRLENDLKSVGRRNPANPSDWEATAGDSTKEADPSLQADALETYAENSAILSDLETRYTEVTDALNRIDQGTFGTCEIAHEPIEPERLAADPAARTCKAHMNG